MQLAFSRVPQRVRLNKMAGKPGKERSRKRDGENASWLKRNSMSIAMFSLFLVSLIGQIVAGHRTYNDDQSEHGQPTVAAAQYVRSGHFVEAVFENWESEFLQMAAFVFLSAVLYQKGSPESRKLQGEPELDADPRQEKKKDSPWPVHRGGLLLRLYEHSLTIALLLLFAISFFLHAQGGAREYSQEQLEHGGEAVSMGAYIGTSRFWFESFQNWQSEFLSVGALIVLSIFLRQRGSPESKPVHEPHWKTGE
jgi:hypothetical protein